ncbi:MAG TPA: hypothetical protein VM689_08175 [Aliidongia sp.]|nr:hypothetical protein [Aliidongia sp.]
MRYTVVAPHYILDQESADVRAIIAEARRLTDLGMSDSEVADGIYTYCYDPTCVGLVVEDVTVTGVVITLDVPGDDETEAGDRLVTALTYIRVARQQGLNDHETASDLADRGLPGAEYLRLQPQHG